MKFGNLLNVALLLVLSFPSIAVAKDKDKSGQRGILESMQALPCGAKERGLTGLGSMMASVGVEHVDAHEQLCPQYLLRTDQMDYHIRPLDLKHAVILPVGHEAEFTIKKNRMFLRVTTKDKKQAYQVVSMQPANSENKVENSSYHPTPPPVTTPLPPTGTNNAVTGTGSNSASSNTMVNQEMTNQQMTDQQSNRPPQE